MVDKMTEDRSLSQREEQPRKLKLSPDVAEFLHMLNALEARSGAGPAKAG
jgi:hypothetical protein